MQELKLFAVQPLDWWIYGEWWRFERFFHVCFLDKKAFHHLYYTETGRPDILMVFGTVRPKLEPRL